MVLAHTIELYSSLTFQKVIANEIGYLANFLSEPRPILEGVLFEFDLEVDQILKHLQTLSRYFLLVLAPVEFVWVELLLVD